QFSFGGYSRVLRNSNIESINLYPQRNYMENDINIETAIIKYLKGNCTDDELAKALNVFEDSQYQFALRNVLYDFWDNNILPEDKHLNNEDKLSVIYRIHHNIHQGNERK